MEEQNLRKRKDRQTCGQKTKTWKEQINEIEVNVPFPNETQELVTKSLQTTNEEHSKKTAGERNEGIGKVGMLKHMEEIEGREKEIEKKVKEIEEREKEIEKEREEIEEREKKVEEIEKEMEGL